jgi:hypothetical protein
VGFPENQQSKEEEIKKEKDWAKMPLGKIYPKKEMGIRGRN